MPNEQLLTQIREWQSRLAGLPESFFSEHDLEALAKEAAQWHASKVIAEQIAVLTIARIMGEHGVTARDLASYYGSGEAKATALGRFCFVTGIAEWPGMVERVFLPLLKVGGYRPIFTYQTARAALDVCTLFTVADRGVRPSDVGDVLYRNGLSPSVAKRVLRTMRQCGQSHPEALQGLWQALGVARRQAVSTIADVHEIGERIEDLEAVTQQGADSAQEGC
jgi:hypothetical protein